VRTRRSRAIRAKRTRRGSERSSDGIIGVEDDWMSDAERKYSGRERNIRRGEQDRRRQECRPTNFEIVAAVR